MECGSRGRDRNLKRKRDAKAWSVLAVQVGWSWGAAERVTPTISHPPHLLVNPGELLRRFEAADPSLASGEMEDFVSESDSDYTSYWRDWVCANRSLCSRASVFSSVRFPATFLATRPAPPTTTRSPRRHSSQNGCALYCLFSTANGTICPSSRSTPDDRRDASHATDPAAAAQGLLPGGSLPRTDRAACLGF